jgi:hypothetical protein
LDYVKLVTEDKLREDYQLVRSLLFTKQRDWAHEKEFRIFRRNYPAGAVPFDKGILKRIIFGARCGPLEFDLVRQWLKEWPHDVVFSKCKQTEDSFELDVEDFDAVSAS